MGMVRREEGSVIVKLQFPVEHNRDTLHEVKMRVEATVADLEAMDKVDGSVGKSLRLISELSGVSLAALRKVRASDYSVLAGEVANILGNESLETGGSS